METFKYKIYSFFRFKPVNEFSEFLLDTYYKYKYYKNTDVMCHWCELMTSVKLLFPLVV